MSAARQIVLPRLGFAEAWREAARGLLLARVPPAEVDWRVEGDDCILPMFGEQQAQPKSSGAELRVSRALIGLIDDALCADVPDRFALPYRALWRSQSERHLAGDASDPDMARLRVLSKLVRRDAHKMKAFVRFREADDGRAERRSFTAWFEPDHFIVEATAPFFARRFGDMDWQIDTPKGCAQCIEGQLEYLPAAEKPAELPDPTDALWQTYYANIFNPARLKVKAMQAEMPKKYWKNLPEARLIPALVAGAEERVIAMREAEATTPVARSLRMQPYVRPGSDAADLIGDRAQLDAEVLQCTRCPLYCNATQAVCGEGPERASIMVVGEQPGDQEDLAGRPFVGPAGREFDAALASAAVERSGLYVTNAVKHFKHTMRGKRRIHERPNTSEITTCRWWLEREVALVQPKIIVALGATASLATTGNGKAVTARQGLIENSLFGAPVIITGHPAAILRVPDASQADRLRHELAVAMSLAAQSA